MTSYLEGILTTKAFQMGIVAGISGTISAVISYHVTKRRLDKDYREIIDREILEARKFYGALHKRDAYASPELVMKEVGLDNAVQALNNYQGLSAAVETEEPIREEKAIKVDMRPISPLSEPEPSTTTSLSERALYMRSDTVPYIITVDEFMEATSENRQQITLTYYSDDDILADDKDLPVVDIAYTIGIENLSHFGEASGDSRVVYIRNERLDVDFEVVLHTGNYSEIVHGIVKEPRRKGRKFRGDDG